MGFLRWWLSLSVVIVHFFPRSSFTGFGSANSVEIFFFLSGYVMQNTFSENYSSSKKFLVSRGLRIYPTYLFSILCIFIMASVLKSPVFFASSDSNIGTSKEIVILGILINFTLIGSDITHFFNLDYAGHLSFIGSEGGLGSFSHVLLIAPAWSLGIELTYYLLVPYFSRRSTKQILIVSSVLLLLRFFCFIQGFNSDPWTYRFFIFELPIFLIGSLIARMGFRKRLVCQIGGVISGFMVLAVFLIVGGFDSFFKLPRFLVLGTLLVFSAFLVSATGQEGSLSRLLGDLSFPLYLLHLPILVIFSKWVDFGNSSVTPYSFAVMLISVGCSYLVLEFNRPIENIRRKYKSQPRGV